MIKAKTADSGLFFDIFESPVGKLFLLFSGKSLAGISFEKPEIKKGHAPDSVKRELKAFFEGKTEKFSCSTIFLEGTDFERKVWQTLNEIPYGETRTYKWLAEKIGNSKANRAVGRALGKNPIPIVFPCHRVIESDGSIGGYSSGVDIKRRLLELEYYNALAKK